MDITRFKEYWDRLIELEEQAQLEEPNLTDHYEKHIIIRGNLGDDLFPENMTKDEYNAACHLLSSTTAKPIGSGKANNQGFITQTGRKIKFKCIDKNMHEFVVYVGDDISGKAITYYNTSYQNIINTCNPYKYFLTDLDYIYKCDLDGKLNGITAFTPSRLLSNAAINKINDKLKRGEPLI